MEAFTYNSLCNRAGQGATTFIYLSLKCLGSVYMKDGAGSGEDNGVIGGWLAGNVSIVRCIGQTGT